MKSFLLLIIGVIGFQSCWILNKQNSLLTGIHKADKEKRLVLLNDQEFRQTRGRLNDTYYAKAGKGTYTLIFESDSGEYYFADEPKFICEYMRVGGIFLNKNDSTFMLWTSGFLKKKKAIKKFSKERFVKQLDRYTSGREPFVHWYYKIERTQLLMTKQ